MKIKLNLLENSIDFLSESLAQYKIADEQGVHHSDRSDYQKKIKWKMAFINLVQATELLMKEIIFRVSPALMHPNVDSFTNGDKSINFSQCLTRLIKFSNITICEEQINQLRRCAELRNRFAHADVSLSSEEMKKRFSSLLLLYNGLFKEKIAKEIPIDKNDKAEIKYLITFADQYTIFRGYEILKNELDEFKKEINTAQLHPNFIDKNGTIVQRIKFGFEEYDVKIKEEKNNFCNIDQIYKREYCDDCGAKQNEYHLLNCDLEKCPICFGQALSCSCKLKWVDCI